MRNQIRKIIYSGELSDKELRLFACRCATRALNRAKEFGREPDARSWAAVGAAEKFANGEITAEELQTAGTAAYAAADAYADAYAAAAAAAYADAYAAAAAAADAAAAYADADKMRIKILKYGLKLLRMDTALCVDLDKLCSKFKWLSTIEAQKIVKYLEGV